MPYHILLKVKQGRDLTNWNHLYAMKDELSVTISNLINRLKSLDWITLYQGSKRIFPGENLPR